MQVWASSWFHGEVWVCVCLCRRLWSCLCVRIAVRVSSFNSCETVVLEALEHHLNHLVASAYLNRQTKVAVAAVSTWH